MKHGVQRELREKLPSHIQKRLSGAKGKYGALKKIWSKMDGINYKAFLAMVSDGEATPTNRKRIEKALKS
jgi:hypothetical protein